jgi:hypothetical protein
MPSPIKSSFWAEKSEPTNISNVAEKHLGIRRFSPWTTFSGREGIEKEKKWPRRSGAIRGYFQPPVLTTG